MRHSPRHVIHRERHAIALSACLTMCVAVGLNANELRAQTTHALTIYPARHASISFDHASHRDASCETCHVRITSSTRASDSHAPAMQQCASCHTSEAKPLLSECSACHVHYTSQVEGDVTSKKEWLAVSPPPLVVHTPQAALTFSHRAHTSSACSDCHDTSGKSDAAVMPSMSSCMTCHDGAQAPDSCHTCHTREHVATMAPPPADQKTSSLALPPSMLTTPRATAPESHAQDWRARHGIIALTQNDDCMTCHTEQSCASCHNAQSGQVLAAHPPNYLIQHRLSARLDEQNCTSCHRQEASCLACHTSMLAAPASEMSSGPPPSVNFHPPTWLNASNANNHGAMARRNINECASCHQEQDCVSCHQGISPHPPEFRASCARILKKNALSCTKCHTSSLDLLCPSM